MNKYKSFSEVKEIFCSWPLPFGFSPDLKNMLGELLDASYFDENHKLIVMGANDDFIDLARVRQRNYEIRESRPIRSLTRYFRSLINPPTKPTGEGEPIEIAKPQFKGGGFYSTGGR